MKTLLSVGLALMASTSAWAVSVPSCSTGSLSSYIALTSGCQIGGDLFYGFSYTGGAGVTDASSVTVTPINIPGNDGLQFNAFWNVAPGVNGDAVLFFNVAALSGSPFRDDSLGLGGVSALSGSAKIDVVEGICLGQALNAANICTGPNQTPPLEVVAPNNTNTYFQDFVFPDGASYSVLGIKKDIGLTGVGSTSTSGVAASLSVITQQFSQVPEPMSLLLFGTCLLALGPVLRRKLG